MGSTSDIMHFWAPVAAMAVAAAAAATAAVIAMLLPLLRRFASVRPNARSSHRAPTPQGGGLAVIAATLATVAVALLVSSQFHADARLVWVGAAAVVLTILGAADDVATLGVAPRLLIQIIAVAVVMAVLPDDLRFIPALPLTVERFAFLVGGLYFVNAVNFMDGIDWMTVAEVVPLAGGLALLGVLGALPPAAVLLALALCGAMIGFAPFNRPVARLFLGDAGSLPIGLLLLWLLLLLAGSHPIAAFLLPLYYIADTGITILWRLMKGETITSAHRSHYYQRALDGGFSVYQIVTRVFLLNILLVALALATVVSPSRTTQMFAPAAGVLLVFTLLRIFSRPPPA
jgi:UDP-N-acetylmuramyl pentapeptide phosphotransferase/UDP-N-acetylglucosamine-1-phosphate transferase